MEVSTAMQEGFAMLFESEAFSDCKIVCGPHHFNLHKSILSSQSKYLMAALKSGTFKEGETGVIELKATSDNADNADDSCDDPEIVKLMIEYFYHFDYLRTAASSSTPAAPNTCLVEHAKVFAMATKYQADGLRQLAVKKFRMATCLYWDHEDFARATHVVYTSTADDVQELRAVVAGAIRIHFHDLRKKTEIDVAISGLGGLAYDILKRMKTETQCGNSGHRGYDGRLTLKCAQWNCTPKFTVCKECVSGRSAVNCPFCRGSVPIA